MPPHLERIPKVLELYLQISQYPILGHRIRARMRQELFARGIITPGQFEQEVKEKAVLSQRREGLADPFAQETAEVWQERLVQIRDHMTDFYFAYNLPHTLFEEIVRDVLAKRAPGQEVTLPFNPELAPWHILLTQAKEYTTLPPEQRKRVGHHLEEITVVLIKSMISDQMAFVRLAKEFLDTEDFEMIGQGRIGEGKIGGKAAGMMLAWKILQREDPADEIDLRGRVAIPDSYFIGADVFYDFHAINGLEEFINQKYKTQEEIEADYPHIQEACAGGRFPEEVMGELRELLTKVGSAPLIVRSSSLLEDNFGFSFAGKYDSFFCPNQGTLEENLAALTNAIARVYASVLGPDALLYQALVKQKKSWEDFVLSFPGNYFAPEEFRRLCHEASGGHEIKRITDIESQTPFSPYNLRLYRQTYHGIRDVLHPLVRDQLVCVLPMQSALPGKPWILEICPASTLKRKGLYLSYKGRTNAHHAARAFVLESLEATGPLSIPAQGVRSAILEDRGGDALDSVIAAFATFRTLRHPALLAVESSDAYALEGYVYV